MAETVKGINIKIGADTTKYSKAMKDAGSEADTVGAKLSAFAGTAAKAIAAASAAAAAGAVALGKAVVSSYANYEQLVGGVDTLFKDASDKVQEYAESAYKTAGLSANDYMETVTSFSASLLQSLGGDTAAAADQANLAITDMSDNANKMGTDMASIQNAYQGFAKQNYTMLDNLKLGYGGTKTEMERLIADANKLKEAQGEAGDLTIDSYSDIIEAIHLVQTEIGITGTTAAEAEATITGSIKMTKAAWENLLISLGSGEGVEENLQALMESAGNVLSNITPVIERIIAALPTAMGALLPEVMALLPTLIETALQLFQQVLAALLESLPMLVEVVLQLIMGAVQTIMDNAPMILEGGVQLITELINGIMEMLPDLLETALELIVSVTDYLIENAPKLIEAGLELVIQLIDGIFENLPELVDTAIELIEKVAETILDNLPLILEKGLELVLKLIEGIVQNLPELIKQAAELIVTFTATIGEHLPEILDSGLKIIAELIKGLLEAIPDIIAAIPDIIKSIVDTFGEYDWLEIGTNIMEGLKDGLLGAWETVKKAVTETCGKIADTFKGWFGIESPSKWFRDQIGKNMMLGLDVGLTNNSEKVLKDASNIAMDLQGAFAMNAGILANSQSSTANLTMTTPVYLDGRVIATVVNQQLGVLL